ncbi:hypothetical protein [Streptomyces sp. NPDC051452]
MGFVPSTAASKSNYTGTTRIPLDAVPAKVVIGGAALAVVRSLDAR